MKEKILLIDSNANNRGFYSSINLILLNILYCQENQLCPVISNSVLKLYGTDFEKIRPFTEFFGDIYNENEKNIKSMEISKIHNDKIYHFYDDAIVQKLSCINKKLIENYTEEIINFNQSKPIGKYTDNFISIHYRGCDYLKNTPFAHKPNLQPDEFIRKIHKYINEQNLFLATDDISFIDKIERYNNKIIFFKDVYRKGPGKGSHMKSLTQKLGIINKKKQLRKAYEVIRDVAWLSKSNTYIGSNSNLMYYSKLLNLNQKQINLSYS